MLIFRFLNLALFVIILNMNFLKNIISYVTLNLSIDIKSFCLCFLFGICSIKLFYYNKSYLLVALTLLILVFYYLGFKCNKFKGLFLWLITNLFACVLGFIWMWLQVALFKHHNNLLSHLEGKKALVQGKVLSLVELGKSKLNQSTKALQIDLELNKVFDQNTGAYKIRLVWFNPNQKIFVGDYWQFCVNLKKPRNFYTKGSLDIEKYYFSERIHMQGKVIFCSDNLIIKKNKYGSIMHKLRHSLSTKVNDLNFAEEGNSNSKKGIILALGVGMKSAVNPKDLQIFQDTGTAHLLSVSGLHISLIVGLVFMMVRIIWAKVVSRNLLEKVPSNIVASVVSIVAALFYAILTGLSIATFRSMIMVNLYLFCLIIRKSINTKQIYFLSMLIILFVDPFCILSNSFWLSFLAVGILLYAYKNFNKQSTCFFKITSLLRTNGIMLIGLLPINAFLFGKVSLISYFANLIAIPIINFLVLPWILMGLFLLQFKVFLAKYLLFFVNYNLNILLNILKQLLKVPYSNIEFTNVSFLTCVIGCIASALLVLIKFSSKDILKKYLAVICFLPLFFRNNNIESPQHGDAFITVLDVGQGLAIVIRLKNHVILYDVGSNNKVTLNYLKSLGYDQIDQVIISHTDSDHIGGLKSLVSSGLVKKFVTNIDGYDAGGLKSQSCIPDFNWQVDGVHFQFLYPSHVNNYDYIRNNHLKYNPYSLAVKKTQNHRQNSEDNKNRENRHNRHNRKNKNDNSCILKITTNKHSMLLAGDISQKLEKLLVKKYAIQLKSDLLLIPHHGSIGSSSEAFIESVKPKVAIVSAGYLNTYGHPRKETLDKYLTKNIKILNTIECGSVNLKLQKNQSNSYATIEYNCYRIAEANFWNY